jgi:hypothetical protein
MHRDLGPPAAGPPALLPTLPVVLTANVEGRLGGNAMSRKRSVMAVLLAGVGAVGRLRRGG